MSARSRVRSVDLLSFAHHLADLASEAIRPHFRKTLLVANKAAKGNYDPVTIADKAAERVIRGALEQKWPDHSIIGEEYDDSTGTSRYSWIVDPIDGTRSFIMGYPTWGTLIGVQDNGAAIIGLMDQPFTGERFWASPKGSFWRQGQARARRLKTRSRRSLSRAIMATTDPLMFANGKEQRLFNAVKTRVAMTRYGGDCYAYCMLSAGLIDLVVEASLKPHDIVALIPIVEKAGGVISTWDGGPAEAGGRIVAAGDRRIHRQVLKLLAR